MMGEHMCSLGPGRDERLLAYIYEQDEPSARRAFESHVGICVTCQTELAELDAVRAHLRQWSPPEPRVLSFVTSPVDARQTAGLSHEPRGLWAQVAALPAWAQAVAALLLLGVAAGAANLHVTYDRAGLSVNTGWMSGFAPASAEQTAAPWRAELVTLEQQLRAELRATTARSVPPRAEADAATSARVANTSNADDVVRRVRTLIEESERKQQRELALRVAEMARDSQAQRQADFAQINRSLGFIQANTGQEMMRNRQRLNSLAVQVSQTRD
jgi:hypothetical protein